MKTIRMGKTNLQVSRVGMGGIPIQRPPLSKAIKVIQCALDLGVTLIDTSPGYDDSEIRIGKAIRGRRDEVTLATKTSWRDKATAQRLLEQSLERFHTDHIELWQFHNVSTLAAYDSLFISDGAMEAAEEAMDAGKIYHVGLSSHSVAVARKAITSGHFKTIMIPFNFIAREPATELIPLAREHDVGFLAMKPFAGGMLEKANLAIKYLLQFDTVIPVPGIEKIEEIEEIVEIVEGAWELTPHEHQQIATLRNELDTQLCRRCGECTPCPHDVNIQPLMNLPQLFKLWPHKGIQAKPWVKNMIESAQHCLDCTGECEPKCPYHLPIRAIITENLTFYNRMVQGKPELK